MALTGTSVIEINTSALAADTNGGAFDSTQAGSFGNDMTYGPYAAVVSGSASSSNTTTVSATWATSSMQGNAFYCPAIPAVGIITGVNPGVSFTLNAAIGTVSGTCYVGGPWKTLDYASTVTLANPNASPNVNVRSGTYTPSIPLVFSNTNSAPMLLGYYQTRGDITPFANQSQRPVVQNSSAIGNNYLCQVGNTNNFGGAYFVIFDGGGLSNNLFTGSRGVVGCQFRNSSSLLQISAVFSEFINISNYVNGFCALCFFDGIAFFNLNGGQCYSCILRGCTETSIQSIGNNGYVENCSIYGGKAGSIYSAAWGGIVSNSIFFGNGTPSSVGINDGNQYEIQQYTNASDVPITGGTQVVPNITLTANPWVNPTATITNWQEATAAFALNNVAGGGALCRGAGTPQYLDIGAVQSAAGGGGGGVPRIVVPRRIW